MILLAALAALALQTPPSAAVPSAAWYAMLWQSVQDADQAGKPAPKPSSSR